MSTTQLQDLEKTAWVFKNIKEDESTIENIEFILNFNDKQKFEINLNRHYSKNILEYSPDKKINEVNEDGFNIEYLHCMIEGNFKINQELNKIVLNSERVFTNQENLFDPKSLVFQIQQKGSLITFPKGGVFNTILKIEDPINLKLHGNSTVKKSF